MRRRTTTCALVLVALAAGGCGGSAARPEGRLSLRVAERVGFDRALLKRADDRFQEMPGLTSVLVMRRGRLVFERYYHGATRTERREIFSVTKSVLSALVGIALQGGELQTLDARVVEFFPRSAKSAAVREISLRDLLTMTAGYGDTPPSATDNSVDTLLNRPLASDPGTRFSYDSGSAHLVAAVLTKATGAVPAVLARRELFRPLRIRPGHWYADGEGRSLGSTGLALRSRDLLRFGELYLHGGRWHARQVVPKAWVRASTRAQVDVPGPCDYGFLWWTCPRLGFYALGSEGQMIAVYPSRQLVLVTTGQGEVDRDAVERLVLGALKE